MLISTWCLSLPHPQHLLRVCIPSSKRPLTKEPRPNSPSPTPPTPASASPDRAKLLHDELQTSRMSTSTKVPIFAAGLDFPSIPKVPFPRPSPSFFFSRRTPQLLRMTVDMAAARCSMPPPHLLGVPTGSLPRSDHHVGYPARV